VADCTYTLQHAGTPETLFPVARREISKSGGSVQGTPESGAVVLATAAGRVRFNYAARGNSVAIEVTDKPWVVSCAKIQSELVKMLAKVPAPQPLDVEGEIGPSRTRPLDPTAPPTDNQVQVLDFTGEGSIVTAAPMPQRDMTKWLLAAGIGAVAIGTGYYLTRKSKPKYRRRTTKS
jgi:hypothetical protein